MTKQRFRSLPLRDNPTRVDREQRVIYGVSAAQAVEALGHGLMLDAKTLQQIVDLGNATKNGVKSRYTHPGLSSDGMGKQLGRMKNFRVEGDKAIGDLHLYESASRTPSGDLAGHVMDLADEDGAAFGMSIVAEGSRVWTLADGTEVSTDDEDGRPKDAMTDLPVFRVTALDAVDVVDEPAANRDGLFSSALWGTNQLAESMFGNFDELLAQAGMTPQQAWGYALKYFDARQVDLKGMSMQNEQSDNAAQDEEIVTAVEIENEESGEGDEVSQEEMQALQAELAAIKQREQAALAQAQELQGKVAAMEKDARTQRFTALAKGWQGEAAKHLQVLEALGEGSDAYAAYVSLQSALSEQIAAGALFSEVGSNPQSVTGSAAERLEAEARKLMAANAQLTFAQAMAQATERNPQLYIEHVAEMRGN